MLHEIETLWRKAFGELSPSSYDLRIRFPKASFRIHSFKEKRLPESKKDEITILRAQNQILNLMFESEICVAVIVGRPAHNGEVVGDLPSVLTGGIYLDSLVNSDLKRDDEESEVFCGAMVPWQESCFDRLLLAIARWEEDSVMFVRFDRPAIFAPYDGGVDIVVLDPDFRSRIREICREWIWVNPR